MQTIFSTGTNITLAGSTPAGILLPLGTRYQVCTTLLAPCQGLKTETCEYPSPFSILNLFANDTVGISAILALLDFLIFPSQEIIKINRQRLKISNVLPE